ncbi:heat stress transcription factor C-1b [Silene latifolia]|uniref:heat stress transcription factor C-1b n=1 Tax=Silene latifolia TaxID=37657 RepID=UPI003D775AC0
MDQHGATSSNNNSNSNMVAPFVLKTYEMVSNPVTDHLISWGRANNSFIVVEPLEFSQRVLPSYFKHNNFSSFVRQLNTYGFRKVDADKWEFANEWFLRGQKQLLRNISRRKHTTRPYYHHQLQELDDRSLLAEIERLRGEQKALDEEVVGMNRRLEATERRPQQMMAFLSEIAKDPDILPRAIMERGRALHICADGPTSPEKRRRLLMLTASSSSSGMGRSNNSEEEGTNFGTVSSSSLELDNFGRCSSSPDTSNSPNSASLAMFSSHHEQYNWNDGVMPVPISSTSTPNYHSFEAGTNNANQAIQHIPNYVPLSDDNKSSSYPFSLFDSGF